MIFNCCVFSIILSLRIVITDYLCGLLPNFHARQQRQASLDNDDQ